MANKARYYLHFWGVWLACVGVGLYLFVTGLIAFTSIQASAQTAEVPTAEFIQTEVERFEATAAELQRQIDELRDRLDSDTGGGGVPIDPDPIDPPDPEPAPDGIWIGEGQSLQEAWDALPDGQTLLIPGGSEFRGGFVLRNKKNATLWVEGTERARLIDQSIRLSGTLENVTIRGLEVVRPARDPLDPNFDINNVPIGEPGLVAEKAGLRVWAKGVRFLDCVFAGHTFGVSLIALDESHESFNGEFIDGITFERTIIRDCYNSNPASDKFRSSGAFFERVENIYFLDSALVRTGWAEGVPNSHRVNENQGIYLNSSSGKLTVVNSVFHETSFCPIQGRSDAEALIDRNVFIGCGGSTYVRQGTISNFLIHRQQGIDDPPGSPTTTEAVMSQDSKLDSPNVVTIRDGLISKPQDVASWWAAVKVRERTKISDVWAVDIDGLNFLARESTVTQMENSGARGDFGEFKDPDSFPGGLDEYLDAQVNRGLGVWDDAKHGADALLDYVGVGD